MRFDDSKEAWDTRRVCFCNLLRSVGPDSGIQIPLEHSQINEHVSRRLISFLRILVKGLHQYPLKFNGNFWSMHEWRSLLLYYRHDRMTQRFSFERQLPGQHFIK